MADFAKMLREHAAGDHARGCQGRCYSCECGRDLATDQRLLEAADHIEAMAGMLAEALSFYDSLDQDHAPGEAALLDKMTAVLARVGGSRE